MTNCTYTLAQRMTGEHGKVFKPVPGIPTNMTIQQARKLAATACVNGFDVVAFNVEAE